VNSPGLTWASLGYCMLATVVFAAFTVPGGAKFYGEACGISIVSTIFAGIGVWGYRHFTPVFGFSAICLVLIVILSPDFSGVPILPAAVLMLAAWLYPTISWLLESKRKAPQ